MRRSPPIDRDIVPLAERIRELFEDADREDSGYWEPASDLVETPKAYVVYAEVPGVDPGAVTVEVDGGRVVIAGDLDAPHPHAPNAFYRMERRRGSFRRAFAIDHPVDTERLAVRCEDGVLEITLPKAAGRAGKSARAR